MYPGEQVRLVTKIGQTAIAADLPAHMAGLTSFSGRVMFLSEDQVSTPIRVFTVKFTRITGHRWGYLIRDSDGAVVAKGRSLAAPTDLLCNIDHTIEAPLQVLLCDDDPAAAIICYANPADPTSNGIDILCPESLAQESWPPNTTVWVDNIPDPGCSPAAADSRVPAFCQTTVWVYMWSDLQIRNTPGQMAFPGSSTWRYWQGAIPYNGNSTSSTQSDLVVFKDEKVGNQVESTYLAIPKDSRPLKPYAAYFWATNTYCVQWVDGADGIARVGCDTASMPSPAYSAP